MVLQTFQGLGRGKGFSVLSRESGIDDRDLARALKPRLLDLISVLAAHGHITRNDILISVADEAETRHTAAVPVTGAQAPATAGQLRTQGENNASHVPEIVELRVGLTQLLGQWREAEHHYALSQRRLDELRERTDSLVAATRGGVESLQRLRTEMKNSNRGARELAEHARSMRAIVESAHALRGLQKVEPRERRDPHGAR